jgi:hypothetical protein
MQEFYKQLRESMKRQNMLLLASAQMRAQMRALRATPDDRAPKLGRTYS